MVTGGTVSFASVLSGAGRDFEVLFVGSDTETFCTFRFAFGFEIGVWICEWSWELPRELGVAPGAVTCP